MEFKYRQQTEKLEKCSGLRQNRTSSRASGEASST